MFFYICYTNCKKIIVLVREESSELRFPSFNYVDPNLFGIRIRIYNVAKYGSYMDPHLQHGNQHVNF